MRVTGKVVVNRSPADLWRLLLDPAVLRRCIPGCEAIERQAPDVYLVRLRAGLGLLKSRLRGEVRIINRVPGERYVLEVTARGRTGSVEGRTEVTLMPVNGSEATELDYSGEGRVGGAIALGGEKLFREVARGFQEQFFRNLSAL